MNQQGHKIPGILTLVGGICIELFMGSQYIWGNIKGYVTSYFRQFEPGLDLKTTFAVFPVQITTGCLLMPVGGYLSTRLHPKVQIALGSGIALSCIFLSTFVENFWFFLFLFGFGYGLGVALMFIVPVV